MKTLLERIAAERGQVALLIDPEKTRDPKSLEQLVAKAHIAGVHYLFVGGSTVTRSDVETTVAFLKSRSKIPVLLFPGASHQLSKDADGLLFLNLISGRNPDFLIGHQVQCAEEVWNSKIEVIPTGYILIDGGRMSSVAYVSQTTPIPADAISIARQTAIAGHLMGQRLLYFDAGSGAKNAISHELIQTIHNTLPCPIIVGGGIRDIATMTALKNAGANVLVIGNYIEENIDFLLDIKDFVKNILPPAPLQRGKTD